METKLKRLQRQWTSTILFAAFVVPIESKDWVSLKYDKIQANLVKFADQTIQIEVQKSASPLVYKFPEPMKIKSFSFELGIKGELQSESHRDFPEDLYFRIGFVQAGTKKLSKFKRLFAPAWIKQLFEMASGEIGIDRILFFGVATDQKFMGKRRIHPKSELIEETIIATRERGQEKIQISHSFETQDRLIGLWLTADGDDTQSSFQLAIKDLVLQVK